jgi:hypothetical protein
MANAKERAIGLDALGLFAAGLINTFLAPLFAVVVFGPGTAARQADLLERVAWIAEHSLRWRGGWLFWFAVTLSFAWSYYALGRHLGGAKQWRQLAMGLALVAAAVDLVGVVVNLTAIPEIADALSTNPYPALLVLYQSLESLATALINVAAFGLYSFAGLLLLPALFSTHDYPRWLRWLGAAEWSIAALATVLLVIAPDLATAPLMVSFALYAPWVWASGWWVVRRKPTPTPP